MIANHTLIYANISAVIRDHSRAIRGYLRSKRCSFAYIH